MSELWSALRPRLEYFATPLPLEALADADAHRAELAPLLVAELAALAADPTPAQADGYVLHLYAMLLLARWREPAAHAPLVSLGHLDEARIDTVFGQLVHASYGRALASTFAGERAPLEALADDPTASAWARAAALEALALAALAGRTAAAPVIDFLADFGRREAAALQQQPDEGEGYPFLEQIVSHLAALGASTARGLIEGWFQAGLIDESYIDQARLEADFRRGPAACLAALQAEGQGLIDELPPEIRAWPDIHHLPPVVITPIPLATLRAPIVRDGAKVGRNEPCPCGSGRKYKLCHGAH